MHQALFFLGQATPKMSGWWYMDFGIKIFSCLLFVVEREKEEGVKVKDIDKR